MADAQGSDSTKTAADALDGWPKPLGEAAYHGLAGEVVKTILPHSEADPAVLLIQFLVAFGNAVGRRPHFFIEDDRHGCNLFAMFAGRTGAGRKGVAGRRIRKLFEVADPEWIERCVKSGLTSGQAVVQAIRDRSEILDKHGNPSHPGVVDKRLFLREEELAGMFRMMNRLGDNLADVIRNAWDGTTLYGPAREETVRATNPHVSIAGDITVEELRKVCRQILLVNGVGNRFLVVCAARSKILRYGRSLANDDLAALATKLREALDAARAIGRVRLQPTAQLRWAEDVYIELSRDRPGLFGAATERAAPQVRRLAMIFALPDGSRKVGTEHLRAALEVWRYCEDSARYVFGDIRDARTETLLIAIREGGENGLSATQVRDLLGRHARFDDVNQALQQLRSAGLITKVTEKTGGRPQTRWIAT